MGRLYDRLLHPSRGACNLEADSNGTSVTHRIGSHPLVSSEGVEDELLGLPPPLLGVCGLGATSIRGVASKAAR